MLNRRPIILDAILRVNPDSTNIPSDYFTLIKPNLNNGNQCPSYIAMNGK